MQQCCRFDRQGSPHPEHQRHQQQASQHQLPAPAPHTGRPQAEAARHAPTPPQGSDHRLQAQHHRQQQPQAAPQFMELQRLQGEQQLIAQAPQTKHPEQRGAAQSAFEPVAAIADQARQQRWSHRREQRRGRGRAGGHQGLQVAFVKAVEQITHHPRHQGPIGNADRNHGNHRLKANHLQEEEAPDQFMDRARNRQQAPDALRWPAVAD